MTDTRLQMEVLADFSTSSDGKIYIGILDDRAPYTFWGPASSNATCQQKNYADSTTVRSVLARKKRRNYNSSGSSIIPARSRQTIMEVVASAFSVDPARVRIHARGGNDSDLEIIVSNGRPNTSGVAGSGNRTSSKRTAPAPRRRPTEIHTWF